LHLRWEQLGCRGTSGSDTSQLHKVSSVHRSIGIAFPGIRRLRAQSCLELKARVPQYVAALMASYAFCPQWVIP